MEDKVSMLPMDDHKTSKRIFLWQREMENWNMGSLHFARQKGIIFRLNYLYSKSVELAHPEAAAELFGDDPKWYVAGLYIGDADDAKRLFEQIRTKVRIDGK